MLDVWGPCFKHISQILYFYSIKAVTVDFSQVVGIRGPAVLQFCWLDVHMTVDTHCVLAGVAAELSRHHFR